MKSKKILFSIIIIAIIAIIVAIYIEEEKSYIDVNDIEYDIKIENEDLLMNTFVATPSTERFINLDNKKMYIVHGEYNKVTKSYEKNVETKKLSQEQIQKVLQLIGMQSDNIEEMPKNITGNCWIITFKNGKVLKLQDLPFEDDLW